MYQEWKKYLVETLPHPRYGGICMLFKFPNNYGATVIRHDKSFGGKAGLFELLALEFESDNHSLKIDQNSVLWDNAIGCLFWEEVIEILEDIKNLS